MKNKKNKDSNSINLESLDLGSINSTDVSDCIITTATTNTIGNWRNTYTNDITNTWSSNSFTTSGSPNVTYNVLGKDIEVNSWCKDTNLSLILALINTLGKKYYVELKKQDVSLPQEIEDYLKIKFRDIIIDDILNKDL